MTVSRELDTLSAWVTAGERDEGVVRQFISTALWSTANTDTGDFWLDSHDVEDLSNNAYEKMADELTEFFTESQIWLAAAIAGGTYTLRDAAHDLWLTREGHGAGFWGRGLGEIGERLTDMLDRFEATFYFGDTGELEVEW